ncbi:MAG: phosphatidylglycerol---prolipoprotein diacylglyceryl transferase, partial [Thermomicrobiales bacterium]|nr:phosphatidylglycerol---prolipoprotein diacylglyceryl transferase [Thermomicrobiales bacterium]
MVVSGAVEQLETATGDGRRIANRLGRAVNRACDRAVRTTVNVRGRNWAAFRVCGVVGFALAVALGGWLAVHQQLSAGVLGVLALGAALTFFALAFGAKVLTGQERLVYYHHELAIFAVSTLILTAIGRPVLPYLDLTALGVGTFLACGRIGCFLAGCCHGRPSRCGVAYGNDHVAIGFPAPLASVRLLPVQLVEAIWAAAAVALGTALVVHQAAPGAAWCSYVVLYDLG